MLKNRKKLPKNRTFAFSSKKTAMIYHIKAPQTIRTSILLPASKSISNRVLLLNALSGRPEKIDNIAVCDDTDVVVRALGEASDWMDVGAAGTAMRFLTAYFSGQDGNFTITGTERMKNRPIQILVDALRRAGAQIEYTEKEGFPPLYIKGHTLKGGSLQLDGSVSSQYISALLMVAPTMTNGLRLQLTGEVISRPYIDITIKLMRKYGVIVFEEGQTLTVPPQQYSPVEHFTVESDWSAASYWYEMIALCKHEDAAVTQEGLRSDSLQGDASIVGLFDKLGVQTAFTSSGATLSRKQPETAGSFSFDFVTMPDMAQTAVVTCALLNRPFRFTGLQSLKIKETDRLAALQAEMRKLGYPLEIHNGNTLEWTGERCAAEPMPVIATYEDHRMAMAFAPASLCMENGIKIADPGVVSKSYPAYWDDLRKAGFTLNET